MTNSEFGKVVVLMGGKSAERKISLNSGQAVYAGLCDASVNAHKFDTGSQSIQELAAGHFDRAWIYRGIDLYPIDITLRHLFEPNALPDTGYTCIKDSSRSPPLLTY